MDLIIRVLKGSVQSGETAVFRDQAQFTLDDARRQEGLVHAEVGRQVESDGAENIVFVSVWRDLEALYHWLGGTNLLATPVLHNGRANLFAHFEVQHYEAYEEEVSAESEIEASTPPIAIDAKG